MAKFKVYAAKESALKLKHPVDGQLRVGGSLWEQDGFTFRLITERALTEDPAQEWRAPESSASAAAASRSASSAGAHAGEA